MRSRWLWLVAILLSVSAACAWAAASGPDVHRAYLKEGGPIEVASAAGYLACLVAILLLGRSGYIASFPHIVVFVGLLGLRELDFDSRFTTMGIFKTLFFVSPEVPMYEKAIGVLAIAVSVWAIWTIVSRHLRPALRDLRGAIRRFPEPMVCGLLLLVASGLDGIGRKLSGLGIALGQGIERAAGGFEEIIELGIPAILLLALIAHIREHRRTAGEQTPSVV